VVIVVEALIRIGRRALKTRLLVGIAGAAFVGIFFLDLPISADRGDRRRYRLSSPHPPRENHSATPLPSRWRQAGIATVVGLVLWWLPVRCA
jgi:chromate transporter